MLRLIGGEPDRVLAACGSCGISDARRATPASVGRNSAAHSAANAGGSLANASLAALALAGVLRSVPVADPSGGIQPGGQAAAKRRMRPICRVTDETVFDRIEVM